MLLNSYILVFIFQSMASGQTGPSLQYVARLVVEDSKIEIDHALIQNHSMAETIVLEWKMKQTVVITSHVPVRILNMNMQ